METMNDQGKKCGCMHHSFMPLFLSAFGLVFLLASLGVITEEVRDIAWPAIVTLAGILKMGDKKCGCC